MYILFNSFYKISPTALKYAVSGKEYYFLINLNIFQFYHQLRMSRATRTVGLLFRCSGESLCFHLNCDYGRTRQTKSRMWDRGAKCKTQFVIPSIFRYYAGLLPSFIYLTRVTRTRAQYVNQYYKQRYIRIITRNGPRGPHQPETYSSVIMHEFVCELLLNARQRFCLPAISFSPTSLFFYRFFFLVPPTYLRYRSASVDEREKKNMRRQKVADGGDTGLFSPEIIVIRTARRDEGSRIEALFAGTIVAGETAKANTTIIRS